LITRACSPCQSVGVERRDELSDEQLESVAGGKGGGAGGVFIGIINTLVDKLTGG